MGIAIYVRQSLEKKDSISLEGQIDFCKRQLLEDEEYEVYQDSGFSGKSIKRPAMEKMLNDIENGIVSKVICYKLDRISRSILDFNNLLELFKNNKVEFVSCTENLDTTSPMGRAMTNIVATFAQLERETIQQRVRDNYYKRGETGRFLGGRVPFGFDKTKIEIDGKKVPILEVNEEQGNIVNQMYEMYAHTSATLGEISNHFNSLGIKSAEGKNWDSGKISRMLKSPLYVKADVDIYNYYKGKGVNITNPIEEFEGTNGAYIYGKREANERRYTNMKDHVLSIGLHEGIVDSRTYIKALSKLDSNQQLCNNGKGTKSWLTGLVKCGYCNYSLSVVTNSANTNYYVCRGKTNLKICNGHSKPLYMNEIESLVQVKLIEKIQKLREVKIDVENKQNKQVNDLKIRMSKIDEEINIYLDKIITANPITMEYINKKIEELDNQKKDIFNLIQKELSASIDVKDVEDIINRASNFGELAFNDKKEIAKLLIDKVEVTDTKVSIRFKI